MQYAHTPSEFTVTQLSRLVRPISQEEVFLPRLDEYPIFHGIVDFGKYSALGFLIGSGKYVVHHYAKKAQHPTNISTTMPSLNQISYPPFSFRDLAKQGARTAFHFGVQFGLTTYFSTSIAAWRGKDRFYDQIIGASLAGALINIRDGPKEMAKGAIVGCVTTTGLTMLQSFQGIH